jgi:hypothetical protein
LYKGDNFPELLNDLVKFEPDPSSYLVTRDTNGCPGGMVGRFSFDARLSNIAGSALSELNVRVAALDNNNLLLTALGNTFGAGGMFPVRQSDDYADGWLAPAAQVDVPFTVCLATMQPFGFFVDVLGEETTVSDDSLNNGRR